MLKIAVDTREQTPFPFKGYDCECQVKTLATGDYSLCGLEGVVGVERKSLSDLMGCLTSKGRERFQRELDRARAFDAFTVVVEAPWSDLAQGRYQSRMSPHSACQSVITFQIRYGVPFIFAGSRPGAEYITFWFLSKFYEEQRKRLAALLSHASACQKWESVSAG